MGKIQYFDILNYIDVSLKKVDVQQNNYFITGPVCGNVQG